MGNYAGLSAEAVGLTDYDAVHPAQDAPARNVTPSAPEANGALHNGTAIPFVMETGPMAPESYRMLPEHIIIAALLLVSFFVPIFHLLG